MIGKITGRVDYVADDLVVLTKAPIRARKSRNSW